MPHSVLLLRGINVGGRNKLPMAALRECLEALGASEVQTYLQSGNAVATLNRALEKTIDIDLSAAIEAAHGFRPAVLRLSAASLAKVIERNPFPAADEAPGSVHVSILEAGPAAAAEEKLAGLKSPTESFRLGRNGLLSARTGWDRPFEAGRPRGERLRLRCHQQELANDPSAGSTTRGQELMSW